MEKKWKKLEKIRQMKETPLIKILGYLSIGFVLFISAIDIAVSASNFNWFRMYFTMVLDAVILYLYFKR